MKKIINYRPIFFIFTFMLLGIYFAKYIFSCNLIYISLLIVLFSCVLFLTIKYKVYKRLILIVLSFIVGLLAFCIDVNSFNNNKINLNNDYTISGVVDEVNNSNYSSNVILKSVYINGKKIKNNIYVRVVDDNTLEEGYILTFNSKLEKTTLFTLGKLNSYYYKYKISYKTSIYSKDLTVDSSKEMSWSNKLKRSLKIKLDKVMPYEESSISYASFFGDKTYIVDSVDQSFIDSGIGHLIAVSGMHISLIVLIMSKFLEKLKTKRTLGYIITGIVIVIFTYLCEFAVSVVRAMIMYFVMSFASIVGRKYDRLNALSVAGIIILLLNPLSVYDYGFLLSIFSVFSIYLFNSFFTKKLKRLKLPDGVVSSVSMVFSAQIGLIPVLLSCFNEFTLISFVVNLICGPVYEIFFILLCLFLLIIIVLPFMSFIMKVPALLISFIVKVSNFANSINGITLRVSSICFFTVLTLYFVMFVISHFVNKNIKLKSILVFIALIITCFFGFMVKNPKENKFSIDCINSYNSYVYSLEVDGNIYCIGEYDYSLRNVNLQYLNNVKYEKAKYLINFGDSITESKLFGNLYKVGEDEEDGILEYNVKYRLKDINVIPVAIGKTLIGVFVETKYKSIFIAKRSVEDADLFQTLYYYNPQIIISNSDFVLNNELISYEVAILKGKEFYSLNKKENHIGNWTFELNDGKIKTRSID